MLSKVGFVNKKTVKKVFFWCFFYLLFGILTFSINKFHINGFFLTIKKFLKKILKNRLHLLKYSAISYKILL
jgi:hypothetical protein